MSNYDFHERRRAAEEKLLERLGGVDRIWRILSRRLAPLENVRRADLHDDLLGVDYWAIRPTGSRPLGIDIKCREEDYNDLLLEFVSNSATGSPGWTINRTNITDFVLYLWPESDVLISYPLLRAATVEHLDEWRTRYPESSNHTTTGGDYRTRWIAVPDPVVYQSIGYRVTGPALTVTTAEPVHGPRCPKCQLPPLASTPEAFDPRYLEHRCENRHSWREKAA
jgi:hypothetical protein